MTAIGVKRFYFVLIIFLYFCGILFSGLVEINLFAEIGATIVATSVWRGTQAIKGVRWGTDGLDRLLAEGSKNSLRADVRAAILGTLTNGFSVWVFKFSEIIADTVESFYRYIVTMATIN